MICTVGPFQIILVILSVAILYIGAIYCILREKLGFQSVVLMIFFPILGAMGIVLSSLLNAKQSRMKQQ